MGGREGREPGGNQESGGWQARGFSGRGWRQGSEIDRLMAAELWEYAESPWVVQFRWVNYMVCQLYVNRAVIKKKKSNYKSPLS